MNDRTCSRCGRQLTGRADQRYCSARCRVAANREAKEPARKKRPRPPLSQTVRDRALDVFRDVQGLKDLMRDDRYPRNRAELEPHIRNSLLFAVRVGAQAIRELDGDEISEPLAGERTAHKPKSPERRRKALEAQRIQVGNVAGLRDHLILTQGSDGPVDDLTELVREIDRAVVGLIDAREWITRNK